MLLWMLDRLLELHSGFNLFSYLSTRAIFAALTSLVLSFILGPHMIRWLTRGQIGQNIRDDGPETHLVKAGTPTMGGTLILVVMIFSTLVWADLSNRYVWTLVGVTTAFGLIGFADDYLKLVVGDSRGLRAKHKYFWQSAVGIGVALFLLLTADGTAQTSLFVPFFKDFQWAMPATVFVIFTYLVIVGSSNAVNLTDGLDGLAIMPAVMVAGALGIIAYLTGNVNHSEYLQITYIPGAGEATVFCAALCGAGLGFLWFNTYPAQVFMGDVGALALGAALGTVAVITRHEFVLLIMGGVFVMETLSVVLQVASFKLTGRRIFRMAPLHHHFELKGWAEPKVIVRFWIITVILVLVGLATLKIR